MTREEFIKKYKNDCRYYFDGYYSDCIDDFLTNIYNDHEAQLKAKNEHLKEFKEAFELQKEAIQSMKQSFEELLKAKDEEIDRLKKINNELLYTPYKKMAREEIKAERKKARSIVAMLFWEWKRAQKWVGKNHFAVKGNEDAFKKAYVMLKEK